MQNIETGYKPEFGLGAVYAGGNAADAEMYNQLEQVKNFLANSRELQSQPLDMDIKGLQAAQARSQNNPDLLQRFAQAQGAGYDKAIRENEIGGLMHQFNKDKAPMEGRAQVDTALQNANLLELQKTISSGKDRNGNDIAPQDLQVLNQELQRQVAMRGQTSELFGKMAIEDKKGDWDLQKQRLANEGHLATAKTTAEKAGHSEVVKALTPVMGYVKNIDTQLAKIDTKEAENEIFMNLLAQGKKKPTPAEVSQIKSQLKSQLQAEKAQYQAIVQYMMKQIPGMEQMPTQPAPATNVIKLD